MLNINIKNVEIYDVGKLAEALVDVSQYLIGEVITDVEFIEQHLKNAGFDVKIEPTMAIINFYEEIDEKMAIDKGITRHEVTLDETP